MEYKNVFNFGVRWNYKSISLFIVLLALPNALGMINLGTPFGFKIHLFQIAIFLAAAIYGPIGGGLSGLVGSLYSGFIMGNPYLVVGNLILGLAAGYMMRKGFNTLVAIAIAFLVQLPWLIFTDVYLVGLSWIFIRNLVIALAISNALWGFIVHITHKHIKKLI